MSLLCSVLHIFTTYTRMFSSIQILVNKKYFHQFSFKFIKNFFHQSSFYLRNFVVQSQWEKSGGKSLGEILDSPSISQRFSIHSSSIGFHSSIFHVGSIFTPKSTQLTLFTRGWVQI